MSARPLPWRVWLTEAGGRRRELQPAASRQAAMNRVDGARGVGYRPGFAAIQHERTGERWERVQGTWFRRVDGAKRPRGARRVA